MITRKGISIYTVCITIGTDNAAVRYTKSSRSLRSLSEGSIPMEFDIIKMSEAHISEIADLEKICFSKPWSENTLRYQLTDDCANFFAAVSNNKIIGYCGCHIAADECYTDNIAVFPDYRKNGDNAEIIEEKKCAFISLEVRPSNTAAVHMYKNLGFEIVGKRKNFYSSPTEDAFIMTLYFKKD